MSNYTMRVRAEIDLKNIKFNMDSMHSNISPGTKIMGVIKTNGYGHGAVEIAKVLETVDYVFGYATATGDEALKLRAAGIKKPILILGYTFEECYDDLINNDIRMAVFTLAHAKKLSEHALKLGKKAYIHIKLDTGMGRIGYEADADNIEIINEIKAISRLDGLELEGIFTHFAKADMEDVAPTKIQLQKYDSFVKKLSDNGVAFKIRHCSNSAGIIRFKEANFDMVRAGITLYGLWPSDETPQDIIALKPVMSLKSHVAYIKTVKSDTQISYGGTYVAKEARKIATIPVGYGDGYPRSLSNKGYVLIKGQKAFITGRVCMDQMMVDVTDISGVTDGDEVTLIGTDGNESLTMEMLGDMSGRFNYELACDINERVPRVYLK